jgi:hypothetical protein
MTTCPRCGRVAGDEIVCAGCGMSLALARRSAADAGLIDSLGLAETGGAAPAGRDARLWRLALLVCAICVLAVVGALLLLHQHGGRPADLAGAPTTTAGSPSPSPAGTPAVTSSPTPSPTGSPAPRTPAPSTSPSTGRSGSPSEVALHSTSPARGTVARTSAGRPPGTPRSVALARGGAGTQCGPHCYSLVVTLAGFPGGSHAVACFSGHSGRFGGYSTTAATSSGCTFKRPHDTVWVLVDGRYRSNTLTW